MGIQEQLTITTISTKGQVILPKAIRDRRLWKPGTKLTVELLGERQPATVVATPAVSAG